jgi:hypothetical protein
MNSQITKYTVDEDVASLPEWQRSEVWADLQAWYNSNKVEDKMLWKKTYIEQFIFIRDYFAHIAEQISVISTHRSKSIELPVYYIKLKDIDIELVIRGNFYDYKVSFNYFGKENFDFMFPLRVFRNPEHYVNSIYCEGFDESWVFPAYTKDHTRFTVELDCTGSFMLFTFIFFLEENINRIKELLD